MKALTETVINLFELAEAEGRLLRQKTLNTLVIALLIVVAAVLLLGSLFLLLASLYYFLVQYWSSYSVFLLMAITGIFISGSIIWYALHLNRKL